MNRRSFLSSILAAGIAPAVVGSGILMPVRKIVVPTETWLYTENMAPYVHAAIADMIKLMPKAAFILDDPLATFDSWMIK